MIHGHKTTCYTLFVLWIPGVYSDDLTDYLINTLRTHYLLFTVVWGFLYNMTGGDYEQCSNSKAQMNKNWKKEQSKHGSNKQIKVR